MKFDFVIGNPPYQNETLGDNKTYAPPVYNLFMDESFKIGEKVELIHPARFLFNAGSTPKAWNKKILEDQHFKILYYEADSSKVFANTDIKGGLVVSYRDSINNFGAIGTFTVFNELNEILKKVVTDNFKSFNSLIYAPESYRFTQNLHDEHPDLKDRKIVVNGKEQPLLSKGHLFDVSTNIFEKLNFIFIDQASDDAEYCCILGRYNNKRMYKWIKKDYIRNHENLDRYKVFLPKSNGSGALGETLSTPVLGMPGQGHTQSFISIGAFTSQYEAESVLKYIKTKFARVMLGTLKVTQDNKKASWSNVPMQDFTDQSDIDWNKSISEIDKQLYKKYGLSNDEIDFIESHVKEMN